MWINQSRKRAIGVFMDLCRTRQSLEVASSEVASSEVASSEVASSTPYDSEE